VLDLILEMARDIIAVGNISDTGEGYCYGEMVGETGKVCFDTPTDIAVGWVREVNV
jgi:hypothetical protein